MVAEQHVSEKIKDMACNWRIAIATHGAVWSHRMDIATKSVGQDSETVKVDARSAATKGSKQKIFQRVMNSAQISMYFVLFIIRLAL